MTLRTRAQARLERHVPDFSRWEKRDPACRLGAREQSGRTEDRAIPGSSVRLPASAVRDMRIREPGRPTPNAPLLMRIVRSPYALSPGARVRMVVRGARERVERERFGGAGWAFRELLREIRGAPGPLRAIDHRPHARPRPFARASASGGSRE